MRRILGILKLLGNARYLPRRTQRSFITSSTAGAHFSVVVDVGAGRAPYRKHISCDKYIAIDREDRGADSIQIEDLTKGIPLPEKSADLVICTEVLEHIPNPDFLVKEMYRIMRPNGTIVLTTPMVWPLHEVPYDSYRYTNFGIEYLLKEAGFTDIRIRPSNGYWYTILSLLLFHNKHWYLYPVNATVNLMGRIAEKFERNDIFPLGQQVVARKL